jgi:hypothetical protein
MKMKIEIALTNFVPEIQPQVGSVYNVRGGKGARLGYMNIIFAITKDRMALIITVDRDGEIISCCSYGVSYFEDKQPIAFVDGFDQLEFVMRSL